MMFNVSMFKYLSLLCFAGMLLASRAIAAPDPAAPAAIVVPDSGWRLWLDRAAAWRDEPDRKSVV